MPIKRLDMKEITDMLNTVIQGDCLEVMKQMPDKCVDMILCDLPYGMTANKWDTVIPYDELWESYKRIIKDKGAIVLTASQPFTSLLVMSNPEYFRYEWIWDKKLSTGALNANNRPMKQHENILVFSRTPCNYYPIMRTGEMKTKGGGKHSENYGKVVPKKSISDQYYPTSILPFSNAVRVGNHHPTQKPVELFSYLIKTYTKEGDVVLDNCLGSGTTAVACKQLKRNFIGIEKEEKYVNVCNQRLSQDLLF